MSGSKSVFGRIKQYLMPGLYGGLLLAVLLLMSAALGNEVVLFQTQQFAVSKVCLLLSAFLCGMISASRVGERRLIAALAGEITLAVVLIVLCVLLDMPLFSLSMGVDLACLVFGGFAGTLAVSRGKKKRKRR